MAAEPRQTRQRAMPAPRARAGAFTIRGLRRRFRAAAWAGAAVVTALAAAGSRSPSHPAPASDGRSPACLPASLDHSAKLAGVPVDVSPAPGTDTANPHSQISFLNVGVTEIHAVSVVGAGSGHHTGRLIGYSQRDGASFVPDAPFTPRESVAVRAVIGATTAGKRIAFSFRVDTPYSTAAVGPFPNPTAAPTDYQSFDTLPGVQAPTLTVTAADRDPAAGDILTTNGPGPGR